MKLLLISILTLCVVSSCNKCEVCTYTNDTGDMIEASESCGNNNAREDFRQSLEQRWGNFGEVTCIEK